MIATAHALIGGAVAASVNDPLLGITVSAISHPLADLVPHWDFGWGWRNKSKQKLFIESFLDVAAGTALAFVFFSNGVPFWYFMACLFASLMWDFAEIPYWFLGWKVPPFVWIYKIQSKMQGKAKLPWGIMTQVVSVLGVILILRAI